MIAKLLQPSCPSRVDRPQGPSATRPAARARRTLAGFAIILAAAASAGCASQRSDRSGLFEPYRVDLPQGNYVTRDMLEQVKPGMTRSQVRAALGSPLLENMFRGDRWDYVFRYLHANGRSEQRRVTIRFSDERVAAIDADELPPHEDPSDPALPGARTPGR